MIDTPRINEIKDLLMEGHREQAWRTLFNWVKADVINQRTFVEIQNYVLNAQPINPRAW